MGLNRDDGGIDRGRDEDRAAPSAHFHLTCTVNKIVNTRREGNRTFVPVCVDDAQNHSERHRMDENRTKLLFLARSKE